MEKAIRYYSLKNEEVSIVNQVVIKNIAAVGWEDTVVEDIIIANEDYYSIIERQIELFEKKDSAIDSLEGFIYGIDEKLKNIDAFANALCTGVITFENEWTTNCAVVTDEGFKSFNLSNIDTGPYGDHLPLYNAFVSFELLDEDIKSSIINSVEYMIANCYSDVLNSHCKALELVAVENIEAMSQRIQRTYIKDSAIITLCIRRLCHSIKYFRLRTDNE